jgi:hypothetical protein
VIKTLKIEEIINPKLQRASLLAINKSDTDIRKASIICRLSLERTSHSLIAQPWRHQFIRVVIVVLGNTVYVALNQQNATCNRILHNVK